MSTRRPLTLERARPATARIAPATFIMSLVCPVNKHEELTDKKSLLDKIESGAVGRADTKELDTLRRIANGRTANLTSSHRENFTSAALIVGQILENRDVLCPFIDERTIVGYKLEAVMRERDGARERANQRVAERRLRIDIYNEQRKQQKL